MRDATLNGMVYFEAVARHSRVTTAAEELSVSPSAVSQQIKSLEEMLGVRLFRRIKRRLVLTEEGERLYHSASQALGILREARSQITRRRDSYKLILRVSPSFGVRWLGPKIAGFVAANPRWDLHIDATPELTDFEKENVDLDVRYGSGDWSGFHTEQIMTDAVLPLCRPDYLAQVRENQNNPADLLTQSRLIHTVKAQLSWEWWLRYHDCAQVDTAGGLRFDRSSMSLQAAKDGAGVVLETAALATNELRSGELVPMFPELGVARFPAYWLICPSRHLSRRPAKVFCDWLREEAADHERRRSQLLTSLDCIEDYDVDFDRP